MFSGFNTNQTTGFANLTNQPGSGFFNATGNVSNAPPSMNQIGQPTTSGFFGQPNTMSRKINNEDAFA
jgi:hypothetical protein